MTRKTDNSATDRTTSGANITQSRKRVLEAELDPKSNKSITSIAKAAGVDRSTVYRARESKEYQEALTKRKAKMTALKPQAIEGLRKVNQILTEFLNTDSQIGEDGQALPIQLPTIDEVSKIAIVLDKTLRTFHDLGIGDEREAEADAITEAGVFTDLETMYYLGAKYEGGEAQLELILSCYASTGEIKDPLSPGDSISNGNGEDGTDIISRPTSLPTGGADA